MHDTFLFKKIADTISELCQINQIHRMTYIEVDVHHDSHVNHKNLLNHLMIECPKLINQQTRITVNKGKTEALTAVVKTVEGIHDETIHN